MTKDIAGSEPEINTRIDIASSELETPEGIVRTLTVTAFHAGNWQKPLPAEEVQPWVDAIKALIQSHDTEKKQQLLAALPKQKHYGNCHGRPTCSCLYAHRNYMLLEVEQIIEANLTPPENEG